MVSSAVATMFWFSLSSYKYKVRQTYLNGLITLNDLIDFRMVDIVTCSYFTSICSNMKKRINNRITSPNIVNVIDFLNVTK